MTQNQTEAKTRLITRYLTLFVILALTLWVVLVPDDSEALAKCETRQSTETCYATLF